MFTYKTKVRIRPEVIKQELVELYSQYQAIDPDGSLRKSKKADNILNGELARSSFSRWNNLNHFYQRLMQHEKPQDNIPILKTYKDGSVLIEVVASAKGNSARVYFKPSITSLTKEIRKAIIPINDENIFVYTDIKAAEFALRAIQCQDQDAINTYKTGEDIYMHFSNLFPEGTPRKIVKTILIANMYGKTSYSVAKDLGITETAAENLLQTIANLMPKFAKLKKDIISYDMRMHGYFAPKGFKQDEKVKVAEIDRIKGFNPNLAWSVYTQSALGFIMQDFTNEFLRHQNGCEQTFLSIFDSVIVEIKRESFERFKEFFNKAWAPLQADEFKIGTTMYESMYV